MGLACTIIDGALFRPGMAKPMSVTKAQFEQKGGEYVEKKKERKKPKKGGESAADKALGWGGFDDRADARRVTLVLKGLFSPEEARSTPGFAAELEADVRQECSKIGPVERLRVFGGNPEGVVTGRFRTEAAAAAAAGRMAGRFFGGRQIEADLWDGVSNFYVKPAKESEEEQAARLERFARELEEDQQDAEQRRRAQQEAAAQQGGAL